MQYSDEEGLGTGRGGEMHSDPQCNEHKVKLKDEEVMCTVCACALLCVYSVTSDNGASQQRTTT